MTTVYCDCNDCYNNDDGICTQNKEDMTALEKWKNDFKGFINELSMPKDDYNGIMEYIDEVPNETQWIPVSERLPEPNARDGLTARFYLAQNEYEDMLVVRYDGKGWEQIYQHEYLEDAVIAWMPLPEPYKAENEP